jgi:hypothetical protein
MLYEKAAVNQAGNGSIKMGAFVRGCAAHKPRYPLQSFCVPQKVFPLLSLALFKNGLRAVFEHGVALCATPHLVTRRHPCRHPSRNAAVDTNSQFQYSEP